MVLKHFLCFTKPVTRVTIHTFSHMYSHLWSEGCHLFKIMFKKLLGLCGVYVCVYVCMWGVTCAAKHVWQAGRGQLFGISSLLPPLCQFGAPNSGQQAWAASTLPSEPWKLCSLFRYQSAPRSK